ncbi:MAG: alpha/beta hydrolase [Candidatus Methylomirabilia bacterium]
MKVLLGVALAVLALWALTRLLEPRLSYFPTRELLADPAAFGLRFEEVSIAASDGVRLHGWYCPPREGTVHRADVVFFHGNAGNVSHRLPKIRALAGLGLGVFIVDYRGFGRSAGTPGDAGLLRDAEAAFQAARVRAAAGGKPLGIYGESVGSLPAVRQAAAQRGAAFLILEGSFPGKRAVAIQMPPFWPFLPFLGGALEMGPHAARVACPVLVMHARADEIIPFALGRAVHDRLTGSRLREWYEIPRGGHNDGFEADEGFFPRIRAFLDRALPQG